MSDLKVAIAHGNYLARGGGELVAEQLARAFDDAPIYYGFGKDKHTPDDLETHSLCNDSVLSRFMDSPVVRDPQYMWSLRHVPELHDYDVVIQSGNEFGWYVPPDDQVVIRYLHSTPRALYDRFPDKGGSLFTTLYAEPARLLYQPTIHYPDRYVCNSELVQHRLSKYWGIEDSDVVYPPVNIEGLRHHTDEHYLYLGRLTPTKQVHEIVTTFNGHPDKTLVVAGTGDDEYVDHLHDIAQDNVDFRGYVSEAKKRQLLAGARATIFNARNEDFGMVPVESCAAGTPVIGIRDGFTQYQFEDGVNGILFDGRFELTRAIDRMESKGVSMSSDELQGWARQFRTERFNEEMRAIVERTIEENQLDPKCLPSKHNKLIGQ